MRLTKRKIEGLEYDPDGPNQQIVWDDRLDNFGVRLYESGTKSFVIRYRNEHNRRRYLTLGKFGRMTLQQARSEALQKFADIDSGEDPTQKRQNKRNAETVNELADDYIERYAKPRKKTWERDERRLERHVRPRWGSRKVESIEHRDVDALHREIGIEDGHKVEANRTLALIQKMFNWARSNGYVDRSAPNPAADVEKFPEQSRDRWVTPEEMPRLLEAIDGEDNVYFRAAFRLLILTAMRKGELKAATWDDVDLERAELHIPDSKTNKSRTIPLSEPAVAILESLPRVEGNPHVLVGRVEGQGLVNLKDAWQRVRERSGLEDVTMHDLRRTAASWVAQLGYSEFVIRRFLGHSTKGVTGVYARMGGAEAIRNAVEDYGNRIRDVEADEGADVISLATAKGNG